MGIEARLKELHAKKVSQFRASELLGVNRYSLEAMIEALGLDWPKGMSKQYTLDGVQASLKEHTKRLGLSVNAVRWRLTRGQDVPERPVPPTPEDAAKFMAYRAAGEPAWRAAQLTGFSYDQLRPVARKHCPGYDHTVKTAKRVRRPNKKEGS